jgi:hypothetical protein
MTIKLVKLGTFSLPIAMYRAPSVVFEIYPEEHTLRPPQTVTMRPANLIGEVWTEQTLANLSSRLQREVFRLIRRHHLVWSDERVLNTRGTLMMYNRENEEHTHTEAVAVGDINYELFTSTFSKATGSGSNPNLQVNDVVWKYWINPASLRSGGSKTFTNPKGWNGILAWNKKLKRTKTIDTSRIGCAALALAEGIELQEKNYPQRFNNNGYTEFVFNLQVKLQFPNPKDVTILELEKVLAFYPQFRYFNTNKTCSY